MTKLPCGRLETCGPCLEVKEKGRTVVCSAVGAMPAASEVMGFLGVEDMSYEELLDVAYEHMIANVGSENVDSEMRQAAPEAAIELFHNNERIK